MVISSLTNFVNSVSLGEEETSMQRTQATHFDKAGREGELGQHHEGRDLVGKVLALDLGRPLSGGRHQLPVPDNDSYGFGG